jgi:adenine-specific DNA-methyltransferase
MDKVQAQRLVKEVFESPFDKDNFIRFTKELLNSYEEASFVHRGNLIPDNFDQSVGSFERIGKYFDGENEVDLLIVNLKKASTLDRARSTQRNFVARYLNGGRGGKQKDAALVAFVSPDTKDWRFSLVKMEYKFEEGKGGKVKVKEEFTPAKRWSFLVGASENSHTAQRQFLDILEDEKRISLKQLEDAFNIEKVTEEFFEKYRELFYRVHDTIGEAVQNDVVIKKDFEEKNVNIVDFSKKLLGQIVFLYFLQKKGWFGVKRDNEWGSGSKRFLRDLFDKKIVEYDNFFNDVLEPLFYDALARDRSDIDHWNDHFKCKIPFLNGGLFDPISGYAWEKTDVLLPKDLFSNGIKDKKTGDVGTGILDIFDRYNFTVKEDEPLDKEVAIDPEMLGKVFENLLEVKDRKSKGTYYTPREIVHYMCEQSLINYLATELEGSVSKDDIESLIKFGEYVAENEATHKARISANPEYVGKYQQKLPESIGEHARMIDEKLANIKICDPAIGSGAFPVGMMKEIVSARRTLNAYLCENGQLSCPRRTNYDFKFECIQNSLYGVDLDPGAVEIAKLRLWLSLIVDEDDIHQIKPLPNLDYKIMQGNSLLEEYEGIKLFDENILNADIFDKDQRVEKIESEQMKLQREYLALHASAQPDNNQKAVIENKLNKLQSELKKLTKSEKNTTSLISLFEQQSEARKKADKLMALHKTFFDITHKKEKDELKKKIESLEWELIETTLKEQNKISELGELEDFKRANVRPFFLWKLHFAEVFRGNGGFDIVIANPPYVKEYVHRSAFDGLRGSPYYQGKMDLWYLFASKGIDLVKNNQGIVTFIAQNNWVTSYGASKMRNKILADTQILSLVDFGDFKIFVAGIQTMVMMFKKNATIDDYTFDYRRLLGNALHLEDVISVLNKKKNAKAEYLTPRIYRNAFKDKMLTFSNFGAETILDKIFNKANFKLDPSKEVAQGIVSPQDCVNKSSQEILGVGFRVGNGIFVVSDEELRALELTQKDLSLIKPFYTTDELKRWYGNQKNKMWIIYTNSDFKDKKKIVEYPGIRAHLDRFKKVITSDNKPYGLHRAREKHFFEGEKIIAVRKCIKPTFTFTDFDCYVSATFYVIKTGRVDQKYLLSILNSKLIAFWLRHRGKMQGNNYQIDKEPIIDIPIYVAPQEGLNSLSSIAVKIIDLIKSKDYLGNSEKQAKVLDLENQIDQMVYLIYGLTEDEIKIIEAT